MRVFVCTCTCVVASYACSCTCICVLYSQDISPIASCVSLQMLRACGLSLTSLPEALFALPLLSHLDFSNNRLAQLSPSISRLTSLRTLDLSANELASLPLMSSLSRLEYFYVNKNQLSCDLTVRTRASISTFIYRIYIYLSLLHCSSLTLSGPLSHATAAGTRRQRKPSQIAAAVVCARKSTALRGQSARDRPRARPRERFTAVLLFRLLCLFSHENTCDLIPVFFFL